MAELVSVLLVVLSAQIHHPVAASYEHLFPLLAAGKTVFFQMVLGVEKLFCTETEADVSVFQIFRPSFQFCFQPADQLAKMPQLLLLPAVLKEFIGIQPVGCSLSGFFICCLLQFLPSLFLALDRSTQFFRLRPCQLQSGLMSGSCISGNGIGRPAFQAVFVLNLFCKPAKVSLPAVDPGKGGSVRFGIDSKPAVDTGDDFRAESFVQPDLQRNDDRIRLFVNRRNRHGLNRFRSVHSSSSWSGTDSMISRILFFWFPLIR